MRTVNVLEAKTTLSRLIEAVETGAEDEIIIARNGKPAARLVPLAKRRPVILGLARQSRDSYASDLASLFSPEIDAEVAGMFDGGSTEPTHDLSEALLLDPAKLKRKP
jgi:prevent-host-death family protein